jgi:hypothetical protein
MSSHEFDNTGDTKKFTVTAFLSFAVVFAFLMLMAQCKGPFHPKVVTEEPHVSMEK